MEKEGKGRVANFGSKGEYVSLNHRGSQLKSNYCIKHTSDLFGMATAVTNALKDRVGVITGMELHHVSLSRFSTTKLRLTGLEFTSEVWLNSNFF